LAIARRVEFLFIQGETFSIFPHRPGVILVVDQSPTREHDGLETGLVEGEQGCFLGSRDEFPGSPVGCGFEGLQTPDHLQLPFIIRGIVDQHVQELARGGVVFVTEADYAL